MPSAPDRQDPSADVRPGDAYVQSFARGLEVIRSFSAGAPRQTLSEVAARAGLTRAGARRILLTLQTLAYVEQQDKRFRLTPKILWYALQRSTNFLMPAISQRVKPPSLLPGI